MKKERTRLKTTLTRQDSKIRRYISERNQEELVKCVDNHKKKFIEFEKIHEDYCQKLDQEDVVIGEENSRYICEVEAKYSAVLVEASNWVSSVTVTEVKEEDSDSKAKEDSSASALSKEVLCAINLPKLELCYFDGNPLQYYPFITAFDETVDAVASTGSAKLNRLVSYTTGVVKTAIESCLIMGGEAGYKTARGIIKERFGNDLIISQTIINSLREGPPAKSALELRRLADELGNSNMVLSRLGSVAEVESQRFIASIVERLQPFLKGKWKKIAMEKKRREQKYPNFANLVNFVKCEADNASDPVYGDSGLLKFNRSSSGNSASYGSQMLIKS